MTATNWLVTVYRRQLLAEDPVQREVARHQLQRLGDLQHVPVRSHDRRPAEWASALVELFSMAGNTVTVRGDAATSGHEPWHGSKSGACVLIDTARGLWFCRSCSTGGTAITFVKAWRGCGTAEAREWLAARYGPVPGQPRRVWEVRL